MECHFVYLNEMKGSMCKDAIPWTHMLQTLCFQTLIQVILWFRVQVHSQQLDFHAYATSPISLLDMEAKPNMEDEH